MLRQRMARYLAHAFWHREKSWRAVSHLSDTCPGASPSVDWGRHVHLTFLEIGSGDWRKSRAQKTNHLHTTTAASSVVSCIGTSPMRHARREALDKLYECTCCVMTWCNKWNLGYSECRTVHSCSWTRNYINRLYNCDSRPVREASLSLLTSPLSRTGDFGELRCIQHILSFQLSCCIWCNCVDSAGVLGVTDTEDAETLRKSRPERPSSHDESLQPPAWNWPGRGRRPAPANGRTPAESWRPADGRSRNAGPRAAVQEESGNANQYVSTVVNILRNKWPLINDICWFCGCYIRTAAHGWLNKRITRPYRV